MNRGEFAYAQARLQARLGRRPSAAAWQALESSRGAAHALALARTSAGAMAGWVEGLDDRMDARGIERHFGARWQREVQEVADWLPRRWQPALQCFGRLPMLAAESEAPAGKVLADWRSRWQQALPDEARAWPAAQAPAQWLLPGLAGGAPRAAAAAEPLQQALRKLLRRQGGSAVAALAYLGLLALDLERLRGRLLALQLLAPRGAGEGPGGD